MKLSFRRITSTTKFIPEIDGLRFIAIMSVVIYHLNTFIRVKDTQQYTDRFEYSLLNRFLSHGHLGVPLFFVISGFILGLPFAKFYSTGESSSFSLKAYFLRRLTRLEPPYILIMTVLLLGSVYVAHTIDWSRGLHSYFASIVYSHNFIYGGSVLPLLNSPAWSLEIEVQFYILAPFMAYIFFIKSPLARRLILLVAILLFLALNYSIKFTFISLANHIQYFLVGFLLADMYNSNSKLFPKTKFDNLIGFFFLALIWVYDTGELKQGYQQFAWEAIQLSSIFFLYYYILFHNIFMFLSLRMITNIGGMCYSIYLLHYPVISFIGNIVVRHPVSKYSFINVPVYCVFILASVMFISSVFFLLIERPCMKKDWFKNLF